MDSQLLAGLEGKCRNIHTELSSLLFWEWDSRHNIPLAEFAKNQSKKVHDILDKEFPASWNAETIEKAPQAVKDILGTLAGIRQDQVLFTTDHTAEAILFATWWPWGNNEKISVRIGVRPLKAVPVSDIELTLSMRKWFCVTA